jgi:hypothetical protein
MICGSPMAPDNPLNVGRRIQKILYWCGLRRDTIPAGITRNYKTNSDKSSGLSKLTFSNVSPDNHFAIKTRPSAHLRLFRAQNADHAIPRRVGAEGAWYGARVLCRLSLELRAVGNCSPAEDEFCQITKAVCD